MPKTYIYWNLHQKIWSLMQSGRVYSHASNVEVTDVEFRVRPAGHARVLESKTKNVHAFVVGTIADGPLGVGSGAVEVSYNPYKGAEFYRKDTGEAVHSARCVRMWPGGKVYAWEVN